MATSNNKFHITLPANWNDQSAYTFVGPQAQGVNHVLNLFIDRFIGDTDLLNFAQDRIAMLRGSFLDMVILKEEEKILPNGTAAYEFVYKLESEGSKSTFHKYVYLIIEKQGYTFSAIFSKQSFKLLGVEVDQIISSFVPMSK